MRNGTEINRDNGLSSGFGLREIYANYQDAVKETFSPDDIIINHNLKSLICGLAHVDEISLNFEYVVKNITNKKSSAPIDYINHHILWVGELNGCDQTFIVKCVDWAVGEEKLFKLILTEDKNVEDWTDYELNLFDKVVSEHISDKEMGFPAGSSILRICEELEKLKLLRLLIN